MAGIRLETVNVDYIFNVLLNDLEYWDREGKDAEKQLAYIAGAVDMANAVKNAIKDLGGK